MEDEPEFAINSLDCHTIRKTFKGLVADGSLPEGRWVDHAESMVRELTGAAIIDPDLILWIIRK